MKIVKLIGNICLWFLVVFFLLMALGSMSTAITAIFMLFIAVALMPIKSIRNIWKMIPAWQIVKPISIFIVFCIAIAMYSPVNAEEVSFLNEKVLSQDGEEGDFDKVKQEEKVSAEIVVKETMIPLDAINDSDAEETEGAVKTTEPMDNATIVPIEKDIIVSKEKDMRGAVVNDDPFPQPTETIPSTSSAILEVHFIDVGQGDATLIMCGDKAMLIDAGDNSKGTTVQKYLEHQGISSLDYVIATHPDADHIGGMDVIVYKFDCGKIFMPDVEKDTATYQELMDVMENKGYQRTVPLAGDTFALGSANFQIISPALTYSETNNNSIVVRLTNGENSFLFTGDAEVQAQQEMTYGGLELKSDVMKIPHHGGTSSFQKWFYNEVKPTYAVISCGKDNSYGHPHKEVLDALQELGISVFRTDEQGNIIAKSDGKEISWSTTPSTTWEAGGVTENVIVDTGTVNSSGTGKNSKYETAPDGAIYIGNKNNQKLHKATCGGLPHAQNQVLFDTLENASAAGYTADNQCQKCMPYGVIAVDETANAPVVKEAINTEPEQVQAPTVNYIGNANNQKLHKASCKKGPKSQNQVPFSSLEEAETAGYTKDNQCKICYPYGK